MRKPKQVELSELEKQALKDSHKFAKAVTQQRKPVKQDFAKTDKGTQISY